MTESGNGGSKGPFQDTPIFGKRGLNLPKFPKFPGIPGINFSFGGRKPVALVVIVLAIIGVIYNLMLVYVGPGEYGIKQVKIGINRGIQEKVYTAGLHLVLPGMEVMHKFPRNLQVFELNNYPTQYTRLNRYEKAAHIQTSDGFFVDVDMAILYRIADPYLLITTVGPGLLYEDNGIVPKAEPVLKEALGELSTEEFYNSPLRVEKTMKAGDMLSAELKPYGIEVVEVLVRYFHYSEEIQKNIEAKKLQDQLVFKNQAERRAAEEGAKLQKVISEGEALVKVKLQEGQAYRVTRTAERDLYVRKQHAEGDKLIKLAEAKRTDLKNKALEGMGSERLVGLKMAEVYEGLEAIILSSDGPRGVNPLDLESTLQMFEVRKGGRR
ncbi:MAG: SPFH domain-containing protein [bacterium]|nr:SPFH domain-containing protein [bacterium]MDT8395341.1 SPFH domain-containing protein [bacterium]